MSKMPAKKKSCFQITSVTPAQVAATGATDDTESLDDPEESRTEDVSAEIHSLPRAELEPGCDGSTSEEALNNVGDSEVMTTLNTPHPGQLANPTGELRKAASGSPQGGQQPLIAQPRPQHQHSSPAAGVAVNSQPPAGAAPPPAALVSCTSRFRVIKLDHGIGEPFRRGRWTCTEFYEKDSEGPVVGRTADSVRHAGVTPDPATDRDGGLGHTVGSGIAPLPHSGQAADAALSSARLQLAETPPQQQIHYQNYSPRLQGAAGSMAPNAFSSSKPAAVPGQPTLGGIQPVPPAGQNGQSAVHVQMPPVTYQPHPPHHHQHPVSHHLTHQSEYYQQQQPAPIQPGLAAGPSPPLSGLSAGPPASGGTYVPGQAGDAAGVGGASGSTGQPGLLQQQTAGLGGAGASMLTGASALQQSVSPYAAGGPPQLHGLHPTSSSVPNVPATAASSSVPAAMPSASSAALPNVAASSLPPGQQPRSRTPVGLGVQGLPPAGFGYMEAGGGKPEDLFTSPSPVVPLMAEVRPFMPESLQLATPTVNSLFGIHIPVDGEGNRASGTNVAAIDNKIEQAMDLVKSHLMYAVREEVEVLKEQIKELYERNSVLERENAVLKSLANSEQLSQLPAQSAATPPQPPPPQLQHHPKPLQLQTQPDPGQQPQPSVTSA